MDELQVRAGWIHGSSPVSLIPQDTSSWTRAAWRKIHKFNPWQWALGSCFVATQDVGSEWISTKILVLPSADQVHVIYLNSYIELKDFCCYISDGSSCGKQLTMVGLKMGSKASTCLIAMPKGNMVL